MDTADLYFVAYEYTWPTNTLETKTLRLFFRICQFFFYCTSFAVHSTARQSLNNVPMHAHTQLRSLHADTIMQATTNHKESQPGIFASSAKIPRSPCNPTYIRRKTPRTCRSKLFVLAQLRSRARQRDRDLPRGTTTTPFGFETPLAP